MANRSDLDRSAHTLRGLLPSGEPVSAKDGFGGPALKPEFTLDDNTGVKIKPDANEEDEKKKEAKEREKSNDKKEELKVKRMEERTKRIGIRQGEKTRRVEARNK